MECATGNRTLELSSAGGPTTPRRRMIFSCRESVHALCMTKRSKNALAEALDAFQSHLSAERRLAAHTVRAYLADTGELIGFLREHEGTEPTLKALLDLTVTEFRAWLSHL